LKGLHPAKSSLILTRSKRDQREENDAWNNGGHKKNRPAKKCPGLRGTQT